VDISIDFLRSGKPMPTYARAHINRVGRRIGNVQVEAWQEQRDRPIAALRGHFLLTPRDA
jgi:acyl-coenzyme A thioesterase PaaI-like protein